MSKHNKRYAVRQQIIMIICSISAMVPILIIIMNSIKSRNAIFTTPYSLPNAKTLSFIGYETVQKRSDFALYYMNSTIVTALSIILIIFLSTMVAYAMTQYDFKGKSILRIFFMLGILIPIRLCSVSILNIILALHLIDTRLALILVYIAQGLPMAILILSQFMETIPGAIIDAARIDGASEFKVYRLILPMMKPALGTVSAFTMLPIWNDLWFPLILASSEEKRTVTLGAMQFMGQFSSDWNALLAALSLAIIPVLILYFIFSKSIMGSLTVGAIK